MDNNTPNVKKRFSFRGSARATPIRNPLCCLLSRLLTMAAIVEDRQLQVAAEREAAKPVSALPTKLELERGGTGGAVVNRGTEEEGSYCLIKNVRHLSNRGFTKLPERYVLPDPDRPGDVLGRVKLPVVDLARLRDPAHRASELETLDAACRQSGFFQASTLQHRPAMPCIFFVSMRAELINACMGARVYMQVVNHGVTRELIDGLLDVARRFFELPLARRARYMSPDVRAPVRYGTSFNQAKDAVLFWRDFLKLGCQPLHAVVALWPDEPADLRYDT